MSRLNVGHVMQPIAGEKISGDGFRVIEREDYVLVAVIDGLGHGPLAHAATEATLRCVEKAAELPPEQILMRCHEATRGMRGTAAAIVRLDRARGCMTHSGVGNVESRLLSESGVFRAFSVNGVLGQQVRKFVSEDTPYAPGDMLIMHTDGVSDRFEVTSASRHRDPQILAGQLVLEHGRSDDQLVLVLREEA